MRSRNMVERDRNRRRFFPTISIGQRFQPGAVTPDELPGRAAGRQDDEQIIDDFRQVVRSRLGDLGIAVLDARLEGEETKSLIGRPDLGSPGRFVIKRVVQRVKALAREFAERRGDPAFVREIDRAMEREGATVQKRIRTTAARSDHRG